MDDTQAAHEAEKLKLALGLTRLILDIGAASAREMFGIGAVDSFRWQSRTLELVKAQLAAVPEAVNG